MNLRLPDKAFWLTDNINAKTYNKTFGCPTGRNGCPGQPGNRLCETLHMYPVRDEDLQFAQEEKKNEVFEAH